MKKILIADDHNIVRSGVVHVLNLAIPFANISEVSTGTELLNQIVTGPWDLVISDISMPGINGIQIIGKIKQMNSQIPILIFSMFPEEHYGVRAIKAGASGYVCKEFADTELVKAVNKILSGRKYISTQVAEELALGLSQEGKQLSYQSLSDREFEILKMLADGIPVSDIAAKLFLSGSTVSTYRTRILLKLKLKSNADLIRFAYINHLL